MELLELWTLLCLLWTRAATSNQVKATSDASQLFSSNKVKATFFHTYPQLFSDGFSAVEDLAWVQQLQQGSATISHVLLVCSLSVIYIYIYICNSCKSCNSSNSSNSCNKAVQQSTMPPWFVYCLSYFLAMLVALHFTPVIDRVGWLVVDFVLAGLQGLQPGSATISHVLLVCSLPVSLIYVYV